MNAAWRFAILLIVLISVPVPSGIAGAQDSEERQYFSETGHYVRGAFLRFYNSANDPSLVYGDPITDAFTSRDGRTVQYFQRARFEIRTGILLNGQVQLTPLGQAAYVPGSQRLDINNPSACRSFPTGFHVCFAFRDFYEANGGEAQFGFPLSPFEFHEHLIVQYFENARFEWRADRPEGQRVVLTDLGRLHFDRLGEETAHLHPARPLDATISSILSIHARAFVMHAVTRPSGQQTVHVVVQSQTQHPIPNATGKVTIRFPDSSIKDYFFTTSSNGLGSVTFDFENQRQGELVPIEVIVTYQGFSARTTTSFRIWY